MRLRGTAVFAALVTAGSGCSAEGASDEPVEIEVVVETDPGIQLPGVRVFFDDELVGTSNAVGSLTASIRGRVGELVTVRHQCPEGHHPDPATRSFRLRDYERDPRPANIRIELRCRPSSRLAAFVVRAKNTPSVRVMLDGVPITVTNCDGVAHLSRRDPPGTDYLLELDASADPSLVPSKTSHLFTLPDAHELFVVDQEFERRRVTRTARARRRRIIKIE